MKHLMKSFCLIFCLFSLCIEASAAIETDSITYKKIEWDSIPHFKAQVIYLTDDVGNTLNNEDGTPQYRVLLVDQFGRYRSKESVSDQHSAIRKAVKKIAGNTLLGTVVGVGWGLLAGQKEGTNKKEKLIYIMAGGVGGAVIGYAISDEDRAKAKEQKKSLKEQNRLLKIYQKNFTTEGKPVKADIDLSKVKGLDISKTEPVSMSAEEVKKELESEEFNIVDTSVWDF